MTEAFDRTAILRIELRAAIAALNACGEHEVAKRAAAGLAWLGEHGMAKGRAA